MNAKNNQPASITLSESDDRIVMNGSEGQEFPCDDPFYHSMDDILAVFETPRHAICCHDLSRRVAQWGLFWGVAFMGILLKGTFLLPGWIIAFYQLLTFVLLVSISIICKWDDQGEFNHVAITRRGIRRDRDCFVTKTSMVRNQILFAHDDTCENQSPKAKALLDFLVLDTF